MKPTAKFPALLFATLCLTAIGADTPAPAAAPAAETPALPVPRSLGEGGSLPAVSSSNPPAVSPSNPPAVSPSNPSNGPAALPVLVTPLAHPKPEDLKPADPDMVVLPKMVVKQKPRPRLTPEIMVTKQAFGEDLAKKKFSALDQALNKYTLPLFGTSLAERALEDEAREKKQQLNLDVLNMTKALETVDPTEAKSLKEAAARP